MTSIKVRFLIDGHNIEHYQMATIRQRVGVVLQDTYLFSGTIRENIRFGKLDATDEEVVEAAKLRMPIILSNIYLPNTKHPCRQEEPI